MFPAEIIINQVKDLYLMDTILYLNPAGCTGGGAEKSLTDLVTHLPPDRFQALVVLLSPGSLENDLKERGVECRVIALPPSLLRLSRGKNKNSILPLLASPFLAFPAAVRLLHLISTRHVRIIHTNGIKAHFLGIPLSILSGRSLVWHFRDLPEEGTQARVFRLLGRLFPKRIIANSAKVKERLGSLDKTRVIYNAVDRELFSAEGDRCKARKRLGLNVDDTVIGTIGHFAPLKGYEDLVRAMPEIIRDIPAARFVIVGEAIYPAYSDYKHHITELVELLGLSDRVVFAGYRDDLPVVLSGLDIFVLPSWSEGFGRANLEAMAAGLPIVSTNVGGIPEVVVDGESGLLVPPRDPPALAEAIIKLAQDKNLCKKMGEAGRRRAEQFTIEKMVDGVVEVYDEIISGISAP